MSLSAKQLALVEETKKAALEVLCHNSRGHYHSLPRTGGWGYPEPYTRDLMICSLGILTSKRQELINGLQRVFRTLAKNQSRLGHISGLVHDPDDRGASDTTALFILALGFFRNFTQQPGFLDRALKKAMTWMEYQSPTDQVIVGQLPTSDWRDEQWILGYGLFVNTIVYSYLRLYGQHDRAEQLKRELSGFTPRGGIINRHIHEGLAMAHKPYYAAWSYKVLSDERFDLLGNSLAILSGLASSFRSKKMVSWIERESEALRQKGDLALPLPPNYFPYIRQDDPDWRCRYAQYNLPGEYHNGGVWPFVCGFYIAAIVAAGKIRLAEKRLLDLTELVRPARKAKVSFGFNEWFKAQDATPRGQDWQSWSAAMYLYAAECIEKNSTPFFDQIREKP